MENFYTCLVKYIFAVLLTTVSLHAQVWTWQHPKPQGNDLNAVAFFYNTPNPGTDSSGFAVGNSGIILHTSNAGRTWVAQNSGTTANLYAVCISPTTSMYAVAVGSNNTLVYTTNRGVTWSVQTVGNGNIGVGETWRGAAYYVGSTSPGQVFICGDSSYIVNFSIPSPTFNIQYPSTQVGSGNGVILNSISFYTNANSVVNQGIGIAVGSGSTILVTNNSGGTWSATSATPMAPQVNLKSVSVQNSSSATVHAFAAGYDNTGLGYIWQTTDAGNSWRNVPSFPANVNTSFTSVCWQGGSSGPTTTIWALTKQGGVFESQDDASSWAPDPYFSNLPPVSLNGVAWPTGALGCIVGAAGKIFTKEAGVGPNDFGWVERDSGSDAPLHDIDFLNTRSGFACGNSGAVSYTTNGGVVWKDNQVGTTSNLYGISFYDSLNGYTCGDAGVIFRTTDGGVNWINQANGTPTYNLTCIRAVNNTTAWVSSDTGTLLQTNDGGATWNVADTLSKKALVKLYFLNQNIGWALCKTDSIFRTTDGGATWQEQRVSNKAGTILNDVYFADYADGWVAGVGIVAHTNNSGSSWAIVSGNSFSPPLAANESLNGISFVDAMDGWVTGTGGEIYTTTNGGAAWSSQVSGTIDNLFAVNMKDIGNGWTAGDNGAILKYSASTATVVAPIVVDFGKVAFGLSKDTAIFVQNTGSASVLLSPPGITEYIPSIPQAQFSDPASSTISVSPASGDSVHLIFSPTLVNGVPSKFRLAVARFPASAGATNFEPAITLLGNGAYSGVEFMNGLSMDFGKVFVGHCAVLPLVIKDTGEIPISLSTIIASISGTSGVFTNISPNTVILPGATDTLWVNYCPKEKTSDVSQLTINGVPNPPNVSLTGQGVAVSFQLSQHVINLDTICINNLTTVNISVKNTGNTTWGTDSTRVVPDNAAAINFQNGTGDCSFGSQMAPGDSCLITFQFVPKNPPGYPDSAWLYFLDAVNDRVDSIHFFWVPTGSSLGNANGPFDTCLRVGLSDTLVDTLVNNYDTLRLDSIVIQGPDAKDFSWLPVFPPSITFPYHIPVGGEIIVKFIFHPSHNGPENATLRCFYPLCPDDTDVGGNNIYAYNACGILNGFSVNPTCIDFGDNLQLGVNTPKTLNSPLTFYNAGAQTLTINVTTVSGNPVFTFTPSSSFTISANSTVTNDVATFNPSKPGCEDDTLIFSCAETNQSYKVCLHGCSFTQGLFTSCPSINFGALLVGATTCIDSCYIVNTGSDSITINSFSQAGNASDFTVTFPSGKTPPLSLAAKDSLLVKYCFNPLQVSAPTFIDTVSFITSVGNTQTILTGSGYVISGTNVYLVPPQLPLAVSQLGAPDCAVYIAMANKADSIQSFRANVLYDYTRLKFDTVFGVGGATGWKLSALNTLPAGKVSFVLSSPNGSFLSGYDNIAELIFTPYYGSAESTLVSFDKSNLDGFRFNILPGQDSTNPTATLIDSAVVSYQAACGLSGSDISFQSGTFMYQNAPNPAMDVANIQFQTGATGSVRLRVLNTFGMEVIEAANGTMSAGSHTVQINVGTLPAGMYFYELTTPDKKLMRQMIVVK